MCDRPDLIYIEEELVERIKNLLSVIRNETDVSLRDEYKKQYNRMIDELIVLKRRIYGDKK